MQEIGDGKGEKELRRVWFGKFLLLLSCEQNFER